jgi:hypothetical protein
VALVWQVYLNCGGLLRGKERYYLNAWGNQNNPQFFPFEVIKLRGTRAYFGNLSALFRASKRNVFLRNSLRHFLCSRSPISGLDSPIDRDSDGW